MLLTERFSTETDAGQAACRPVSLRLYGGTPNERLVHLAAGKHSIGSGPRCSVRLQDPGVHPLHCLIVHDAEGVRARRWANDTLLNGEAFNEAPLVSGDWLSVGSIELEVVDSTPAVEADTPQHAVPDLVADGPAQNEPPVPWSTADEVEQLREASTAARCRSRKLIAALRSHRDAFAELVDRIDALERKVDAAVDQWASHADAQQGAEQLVTDAYQEPQESEDRFADWEWEHSEPAATFLRQAEHGREASDWASAAESPTEHGSASWADQWPESTGGSAEVAPTDPEIVAELAATAQQLAHAEQRLADAQATIDALEDQLAEHDLEREQLAEERADWLRQMEELEARLSEYAQRVPELEAQLEQLCEANEAAARVRRSLSQQAAAVPRPAEPEDEYDWAGHAADGPQEASNADEASDPDRQGWSSPRAAAESTDPTVVATPSESEPAPEFDWPTGGAATSPIGTDFRGADEVEADGTDEEVASVESPADAAEEPVSVEAEARDVPARLTDPDSPERKSNELEEIAARLHGPSLWRDEADDANQPAAEPETTSESAPAVDPPPAEGSAADQAAAVPDEHELPAIDSRTASFIERYAHLFEDDEAGQPSPPAPEPSPTAEEGSSAEPIEPPAACAPLTESAKEGDNDEESIEQYMAKMMHRLRGDSTSAPSSQAPPSAAAEPGLKQPSATAAGAGATASNSDPDAGEAPTAESKLDGLPERKRGPAPERSTDMAALRALANQTARHAIGVHTAGKLRRHAVTRFIIAMLAGTASLYFFLVAPGWESFEFATASVALLASIYWGRLTLGSLIQAVRVGAFDGYDTEFAAVDAVSEPLPIDVEHDERSADQRPAPVPGRGYWRSD